MKLFVVITSMLYIRVGNAASCALNSGSLQSAIEVLKLTKPDSPWDTERFERVKNTLISFFRKDCSCFDQYTIDRMVKHVLKYANKTEESNPQISDKSHIALTADEQRSFDMDERVDIKGVENILYTTLGSKDRTKAFIYAIDVGDWMSWEIRKKHGAILSLFVTTNCKDIYSDVVATTIRQMCINKTLRTLKPFCSFFSISFTNGIYSKPDVANVELQGMDPGVQVVMDIIVHELSNIQPRDYTGEELCFESIEGNIKFLLEFYRHGKDTFSSDKVKDIIKYINDKNEFPEQKASSVIFLCSGNASFESFKSTATCISDYISVGEKQILPVGTNEHVSKEMITVNCRSRYVKIDREVLCIYFDLSRVSANKRAMSALIEYIFVSSAEEKMKHSAQSVQSVYFSVKYLVLCGHPALAFTADWARKGEDIGEKVHSIMTDVIKDEEKTISNTLLNNDLVDTDIFGTYKSEAVTHLKTKFTKKSSKFINLIKDEILSDNTDFKGLCDEIGKIDREKTVDFLKEATQTTVHYLITK